MATEDGRDIAFAVPGDPGLTTGGYLYDRRLGEALVARGLRLRHLRLGDSFPHPDARDMADALAQLSALPRDCPALVDGLAYGALDPEGVARLAVPMVALVHHPLALEPGLSAAQAADMAARERAYHELKYRILEGRLPPGTTLLETAWPQSGSAWRDRGSWHPELTQCPMCRH